VDAIDLLGNIVLALLAISAAAMLEPRLGVAAPLLLIAAGIGVSFLPGAPRSTSSRSGSSPAC
jgi:CPA1 family monovalent cation:H+ antiporter